MSTTASIVATTARLRSRLDAGSGRTQVTVVAAQLLAGIGNLLVSLIAARLLAPAAYADVVTFLALYMAVHVPAAALTASGAIDPGSAERVRRTAIPVGLAAGAIVALGSPILAVATGLPVIMVLALASALPGAAGLGIARGGAYARRDVRAIAGSLVAEPISRAGVGVVLMLAMGGTGAALAAVLGGYAAWWIAARHDTGLQPAAVGSVGRRTAAQRRVALGVAAAFIGLTILQVVDLVIANARLDGIEAARFGALSTLGGAAVFATATVPLVLLSESAHDGASSEARRVAISLTVGIGLAVAAIGWLFARPILGFTAGGALVDAAPWLGLYLVAMAALGVARVQIAAALTTGDGRFVLGALAFAVVAQPFAQLALGSSVGAVAVITLSITVALVLALSLSPRSVTALRPHALDELVGSGRPTTMIGRLVGTERFAAHRTLGVRTELLALVTLCVVAAMLRVATTRGLWVDEAISVRQAQMPFADMIADLRTSDVHPPLHHALLWVTVRVFGTSELAVRLPSILAGVALVPALLWTGRVVYNRRTGWLAAGFATIAPFLVWYAQEARMYTLFMLFATISVGAQVQAIRRGRRGDWLLYGLSTVALLWTQYFALLPLIVQQIAFAVVAIHRRRRRDPDAGRFTRDWLVSTGLIVALSFPLVTILQDQFVAYTQRSSELVPGQAGTSSSLISGELTVYAIAANLIWGIWGYHADDTMVELTAFWPLLMLVALALLGRGRSRLTLLLGALVVVPLTALFAIGAAKRDLFELRYFSGAVPIALLLGARFITVLARARHVLIGAAVLAGTTLGVGLLDQQLNGANPRLYDFEGALAEIARVDGSEDAVLVYEPAYLGDVIDYYAADLDLETAPLGSTIPPDASTVWVLATEDVLDERATSGRVGAVLAELEQTRGDSRVVRRPNVRVWELP